MDSILIVDDNTRNLQLLAQILHECEFEPIMSTSGKQALDYLNTAKPQLILLDVMMPDMDGYTVCRIIKSDIELRDIPVIFLTAKVDIDDVAAGYAAGGVDYITKPFNFIELKTKLLTHIDLKKSHELIRKYEAEFGVITKPSMVKAG